MDPQLNIRGMLALRLFTSTELVGAHGLQAVISSSANRAMPFWASRSYPHIGARGSAVPHQAPPTPPRR